MGFFDSLMKGFNGVQQDRENKEIIDLYNDSCESDRNYRRTAFENSQSNHGWYTCAKCGRKFRKEDMDADHIVPQSRGGDNSRYNLQLLCKHCNRSKQASMNETRQDLARRQQEIKKQNKQDREFLKRI